MGWYFLSDSNRNNTIKEAIGEGTWDNKDGTIVTNKCLAKQFKGNPFSGVLYAVVNITRKNNQGQEFLNQNYILVCLLRYSKRDNGWGYKPMEEACGPYNYSCPLKYLEMCPIVKNNNWRDMVKHYWQERKNKRELQKSIPVSIY